MALIASIDGPTRRILLDASTVGASVNPIDIYKEVRTMRRLDENLRKYDTFFTAFGNIAKGGGKFTERYVQCNLGTRIVPFNATQELTITGVIITDDAQEGTACFDRTPLSPTTVVDINYVPPQVEVVRADAELQAINSISFNGGVLIDEIDGIDLMPFPAGNEANPVKTLAFALAISVVNKTRKIFTIGGLTINNGEDISKYTLVGENPSLTTYTFVLGCITDQVKVSKAELTGDANGSFEITKCHLEGLRGVGGVNSETNILDSIIETSGLTLSTNNTQHVHIINCRTGPPDNTFVPIDFNGVGGDITIAAFSGQIEIVNMSNDQNMKIFIDNGRINIAASCTLGNIHIHGDAKVTNSSTNIITSNGRLVDLTTGTRFNNLPTDVWAKQLEGIFSAEDLMRIIAAVASGKVSGFDTLQPIFLATGGTKPRVAATVDNNGNRTAITIDATP